MANSRQRRHAARQAARVAARNVKTFGMASHDTGNGPLNPTNIGGKTAGRMTCYVPGALCRLEHARKLSKRWSIK